MEKSLEFELYPQCEIRPGFGKKYVADFCFRTDVYFLDIYTPENGLKLIIECDGHDYHSSKAQIRERQRRYRERQREKENNVTNALESNVNCSISTSYSYSNNSNISNLNYILENNIHTDSSYVLENEDLHQCLEEWMQYKDGRKPKSSNHYGTEIGLKKTITQFVSGYREYGIEALKKVVDDSMANNYSGVVWDKLSRMQKKSKALSEKPKTQNMNDRFSCLESSFRKTLEDAGVIEGQSLNYGPIRDHPEWLQRLKECGVSDL